MNELLIFIFAFAAGMAVHFIFNRMLGIGAGIIFFKQAELECLKMLALSLEDAAFMKAAKQKIMKQFDYEANAIKITINEDDFTLDQWKKASVVRLVDRYPTNIAGRAHYDDWKSAMAYLNEHADEVRGW